MSHFKDLLEQYSDKPVDFVVVYIEEAHPTDGWSFEGNAYQIAQPKTTMERLSAAKMFADDTQVSCPILVDDMTNEANVAYGALPERLYILYNGKVAFEGGKGPHFYNLNKMQASLDNLLNAQ